MNAIAGAPVLLREGVFTEDARRFRHALELHPRTAAGVNEPGDRLILVVVDGRQPGYSEGMTLEEVAEVLRRHGAWHAVNLDGGGSTTMAMEDPVTHAPGLVNASSDKDAASGRPVGSSLAVFARPVPKP